MSDAGLRKPGQKEPLTGRAGDLELIRSFVGMAAVRGGVLLLSGEPGVGKTALLDAAASEASASGLRVLRAGGAEFEADISFSGLNQLLLPLLEDLSRLDGSHRDALSVGRLRRPPTSRSCARSAWPVSRRGWP